MIAICNPELNGDVLWSVSIARTLSEKHGTQADFYLSNLGKRLSDLLGAQKFVRKVLVDERWVMSRDGGSHDMEVDPTQKYEAVYQLGFRSWLPAGGFPLSAYASRVTGVERGDHRFDLPDDKSGLPDGPFVSLVWKDPPENNQGRWRGMFRRFIKDCWMPVVECGHPGSAIATDLGTLDRTAWGFLKMAQVISHSAIFYGFISAPLVIADSFPGLRRVAIHDGLHWSLSACTPAAIGLNFYLNTDNHEELLNLLPPKPPPPPKVTEQEWLSARTVEQWMALQTRWNAP